MAASKRAELKTKASKASVTDFIAAIPDEGRRADCQLVADLMAEVTGAPATMWGNIVGYGSYDYTYARGRSGTWFVAGFAPRARNITLYVMSGFTGYEELMARLGKHKTGKSCLYINKLADVDIGVLRELVQASVEAIRERYPAAPTGD